MCINVRLRKMRCQYCEGEANYWNESYGAICDLCFERLKREVRNKCK